MHDKDDIVDLLINAKADVNLQDKVVSIKSSQRVRSKQYTNLSAITSRCRLYISLVIQH